MRQDTIWNIIGAVRRLMDVLPHGVALRFGAMCAGLAGAMSRRTVDRAERNCVRAMQVGVTRARSIVRGSYANLGRSVAEFSRMTRHPEITDNVVVHGEENLKAALAAGKGAILLSAHMGNWELGAAALARRGFPVNAIGADQRDEFTGRDGEGQAAQRLRAIGKAVAAGKALAHIRQRQQGHWKFWSVARTKLRS